MLSKSARASAPTRPTLALVQGRPSISARITAIDHTRRLQLAADLRRLADSAEAGHITGIAYAVIQPNGDTRHGLLADAADNRPLAHFAVSRLADLTLWPEKYSPRPQSGGK